MYIHIGINIDTYANSLSHTHTHKRTRTHTGIGGGSGGASRPQGLRRASRPQSQVQVFFLSLDLKDFVRVDHEVKFRFLFSPLDLKGFAVRVYHKVKFRSLFFSP